MPRQHFRRIGGPPSQAINQGLTLHLDIAADLVQNFLTPSPSQPGTTGKSYQQAKKEKKRGSILPEQPPIQFITSIAADFGGKGLEGGDCGKKC